MCVTGVASAYGHLSTALTMGGGPGTQGELNFQANKALLSLSEALEEAKVRLGGGHCNWFKHILFQS